jgi:hypothetical protein
MAAMRIVPIALAVALLAIPAFAKDRVPQGIGFAQTKDRTWLCRHEDPFEALSCAREHCKEQAPDEECVSTAWCYPDDWSGVLTIHLPDADKTRVLCGMADEKTLKDMLTTLCASNAAALSCDLTLTVDPGGNERKVEGVSFVGGGAPPPPPPEEAAPSVEEPAPSVEEPAPPVEETAPAPESGAADKTKQTDTGGETEEGK